MERRRSSFQINLGTSTDFDLTKRDIQTLYVLFWLFFIYSLQAPVPTVSAYLGDYNAGTYGRGFKHHLMRKRVEIKERNQVPSRQKYSNNNNIVNEGCLLEAEVGACCLITAGSLVFQILCSTPGIQGLIIHPLSRESVQRPARTL